ncbi:F-box/LRR-repeat protein 4-like isoform X1 [Tachypleus tridentatus]|uniref:F-box/LRR-repeat protein 4-like isoform X1 n=1 Tax=Tachypleus tridentatus TaxID=6853 RepID=UPI003FCFCDD1
MPKKNTVFQDMPYELQLKVFSFLTPKELCHCVAPVCKEWLERAYDPVLWKSLNLKNFVRDEKDVNSVCTILIRSTMLRSLTLRASSFPLDKIAFYSSYFPLLKKLDLGFCVGVGNEVLCTFITSCPLIEDLNVEGCVGVDCQAVCKIICLKHLKKLNLSHCTHVNNEAVMKIASHCSKLESLNIDGITRITDSAVCLLGDNLHSSLQHLEVDGEDLTDASYLSLSKCIYLKTFAVSYAEEMTDQSLEYLKQKMKELRWLKLRRGSKLTTLALNNFFKSCCLKHLAHLDLDSLSLDDHCVANITSCCRNLHSFSLAWCWEISDVGLEDIILHCSKLEVLDLTGLYKLAGVCLLKVPYLVPRLRYLNLEQCNDIIDAILTRLVKVMPYLKVINYYGEVVEPSSSSSESEYEDNVQLPEVSS